MNQEGLIREGFDQTWSNAFAWWNGRRLLYNAGLAIAGILAFACYATAFELWPPHDEESEITLFTIVAEGVGYLVAMALANLAFTGGPILEGLLRLPRPDQYRRWVFWLGFTFSALLPFSVPVLFYVTYGLHY